MQINNCYFVLQQTKDDLGLVGPKTDREERLASAPPRLGTDEMCQVDTILQDLWHCAVAVGTDIPLTECQTDPSVVDTAICDTVFEEHSYIKQNSLVRITLLQLPNNINLSSGKEHCLFPPSPSLHLSTSLPLSPSLFLYISVDMQINVHANRSYFEKQAHATCKTAWRIKVTSGMLNILTFQHDLVELNL